MNTEVKNGHLERERAVLSFFLFPAHREIETRNYQTHPSAHQTWNQEIKLIACGLFYFIYCLNRSKNQYSKSLCDQKNQFFSDFPEMEDRSVLDFLRLFEKNRESCGQKVFFLRKNSITFRFSRKGGWVRFGLSEAFRKKTKKLFFFLFEPSTRGAFPKNEKVI